MQDAQARLLASYRRANEYLDAGLIRRDSHAVLHSRRPRREWMLEFLPRLGHPQRSFDAVHVAGTSGKGSVCVMVAEILRAAGVSTGLHVTPYLQAATEKLWCDGRYASPEEFCELIEWIRPHAQACRGPQVPMHGMASVAIALEYFRRKQVEVGVVEVGVGGRDDLTNVLCTRVAVVGSVGMDHVKTLGPTLEDIAAHKVGIIVPGCRALVLAGPALPAARRQCREAGVELAVLSPSEYHGCESAGVQCLSYRSAQYCLADVPLAMPGLFQAQNAALAIRAIELLDRDIPLDAVRQGLQKARLPGRLEVVPPRKEDPCRVMLDGAHNADKLAACLSALETSDYKDLHVVFGATHHQGLEKAVAELAARASTLIATEPRVFGKAAVPTGDIIRLAEGAGCRLESEAKPESALERALARAKSADLILATGSLYLVGNLRRRWYPDEQVLLRRQSW